MVVQRSNARPIPLHSFGDWRSALINGGSRYIGGLVDFTGEVGRVAVLAATRRDQPQVEKALAAALTVQDALM